MKLLKIKPLPIVYQNITGGKKSQKTPYYNSPRNTNVVFSEAKKFHVLIYEEGKLYYSFHLCAILELMGYDLAAIKDLVFDNEELKFSTRFGTYTAGSLIEIEDPLLK